MWYRQLSPIAWYVGALIFATAIAVVLLMVDSFDNSNFTHGYLLWNLALAWVPFVLVVWLKWLLTRKLWSSWEGIAVTIAWLAFLPNAFYMISDYVHLTGAEPSRIEFEVVMFTSFVCVSVILGLTGLYLVHRELLKRMSGHAAAVIVGVILLACSFAIYIGRDLRWNSWDLLVNPGGLLFDVSERLYHPSQYPDILAFVTPFFILLTGMYLLTWTSIRAAGKYGRP